jgi:hypothetical protein
MTSVQIVLGVLVLWAPPSQQPRAEAGKSPAHAKPAPSVMPKGPAQLKPMYLGRSLFTPNKWWKYEGADEDRPAAYSVEQYGTVSIGGDFEPKHGAQVKYLVAVFADANKAHNFFLQRKTWRPAGKAVHRIVAQPHLGDEAFSLRDYFVVHGKGQGLARMDTVRFGRYVVMVDSTANMRDFVPKPKRGERPWLNENTHQRVLDAAVARWAHYRAILGGSTRTSGGGR